MRLETCREIDQASEKSYQIVTNENSARDSCNITESLFISHGVWGISATRARGAADGRRGGSERDNARRMTADGGLIRRTCPFPRH
ncbi:jg9126 [Pararge aegeria aegeria]|uniref:Jg9126 protein n=1 Tax=Pararge aegeria aegeria TaxID=348720 RepID=A0A8S4QQ40_9NEOP|nr:jg9126 [Pararge aegeria aegeria]